MEPREGKTYFEHISQCILRGKNVTLNIFIDEKLISFINMNTTIVGLLLAFRSISLLRLRRNIRKISYISSLAVRKNALWQFNNYSRIIIIR